MEKIILGHGQGKTTRLIHSASSKGFTIVCLNETEKRRIQAQAVVFGIELEEPITFDNFLDSNFIRTRRKRFKGFLIDNADMLLEKITDVPVITITLSS